MHTHDALSKKAFRKLPKPGIFSLSKASRKLHRVKGHWCTPIATPRITLKGTGPGKNVWIFCEIFNKSFSWKVTGKAQMETGLSFFRHKMKKGSRRAQLLVGGWKSSTYLLWSRDPRVAPHPGRPSYRVTSTDAPGGSASREDAGWPLGRIFWRAPPAGWRIDMLRAPATCLRIVRHLEDNKKTLSLRCKKWTYPPNIFVHTTKK